jgi:hypothetical protein
MVITSQYFTGMIRASLVDVPKRVPMLATKSVVFALLVFVVGEVTDFPSFFIGAAWSQLATGSVHCGQSTINLSPSSALGGDRAPCGSRMARSLPRPG